MIVYVVFLGYIKIYDTSLPIGTLDILNIVCVLVLVKTYTTNSKILRRLDTMKLVSEKHFQESQQGISEGFQGLEKNIIGTSVHTRMSIKNVNNSVSSLNGLVTNMGLQGEERLGNRHTVGLEIC